MVSVKTCSAFLGDVVWALGVPALHTRTGGNCREPVFLQAQCVLHCYKKGLGPETAERYILLAGVGAGGGCEACWFWRLAISVVFIWRVFVFGDVVKSFFTGCFERMYLGDVLADVFRDVLALVLGMSLGILCKACRGMSLLGCLCECVFGDVCAVVLGDDSLWGTRGCFRGCLCGCLCSFGRCLGMSFGDILEYASRAL